MCSSSSSHENRDEHSVSAAESALEAAEEPAPDEELTGLPAGPFESPHRVAHELADMLIGTGSDATRSGGGSRSIAACSDVGGYAIVPLQSDENYFLGLSLKGYLLPNLWEQICYAN